jgi:hypothetical protein
MQPCCILAVACAIASAVCCQHKGLALVAMLLDHLIVELEGPEVRQAVCLFTSGPEQSVLLVLLQ